MKVFFQYNKEKDIWSLLNKGKNSNNSQTPTKQYEQLVATFGENPTNKTTSAFIEKYIGDNNFDIQKYIEKYQKDWDIIANEYQKRAEIIFGLSLPSDVTGYLSINSRCPYSVENNYFFISFSSLFPRGIVMHELWHFYTWYKFGINEEQKLGKQKYNDLKETLTVLLNLECMELFSESLFDKGYPQHQELRQEITKFWKKEKNIVRLWEHLTQ